MFSIIIVACGRARMQGRFSGRLRRKADEKALVEQCRLLGPLLGGRPGAGNESMSHLSAIVRGVASGQVYHTLVAREALIAVRTTSLVKLLSRAAAPERLTNASLLFTAWQG